MTDSKIKKIRERIKKLLNMAGDASSPNEAAIAAKRAKALLDEYNLSEADVIAGDMSTDDFGTVNAGDAYVRFPKWMNILGPAIASYTGTYCVFDVFVGPAPRYPKMKRIVFKGHADDLMLAEYLFTYLTRVVEKMTKEAGIKYIGPRTSFKYGMASEICKTLREMAKQEEEWFRTNSDSKALVVVDKKALLMKEKFGVVKYSRSGHRVSSDFDAERGAEAGRGVSIRRGLAGTSKGPAGYLK